MQDVMIDIETLGTTPGSVVLSIGAVVFDRFTGEIGEEFYRCMGLNALTVGEINADTCKWWSMQSEEAKAALFAGKDDPLTVAKELQNFIRETDKVWGNGSTFDISLLDAWYRNLGLTAPWKFWNARDVRTIVDVANIDYKSYPFTGVVHNALHDAIHQVKYTVDGIKKLKGL